MGLWIRAHRAELVTVKFLVVQSIALLLKKDRAFGLQFDDQTQNWGEPRKNTDDDKNGQNHIKTPFDKLVKRLIDRNLTHGNNGQISVISEVQPLAVNVFIVWEEF